MFRITATNPASLQDLNQLFHNSIALFRMKKHEFNQGVTFKVFAHDHVRSDGTNTLYLRVTIDRKKKEFNLKSYWPKDKFDIDRQIALQRHPKDGDVTGVNLIIEEAKGRANRIKLRYFTDAKSLTLDLFAKEFENYESRENFLYYWENKMQAVYEDGKIVKSSLIRHKTNHKRLTEFVKNNGFLAMNDITIDFIARYQKWLKKKLKYNTVINALKCMQTYYNHAKEDGYKIGDPFTKTSLRYLPGQREVLEQHEVEALIELFEKKTLPDTAQEVLRKFLFSCFTGIRISDSAHVSRSMIKQNILHLKLKKGERYGKEVTIPLMNEALDLIKGRKGMLFESIEDPVCNRWLKNIASDAKIDKKLTFHVSRDTFATLFIDAGNDAFTLKEILGHSSINTTQIYVKLSENKKEKSISTMSEMFKRKSRTKSPTLLISKNSSE